MRLAVSLIKQFPGSTLQYTIGIAVLCLAIQSHAASNYEDSIIDTIQDIQNSNIDASLESLSQLVEQYPNSKLGHLVMADLLAIRGGSRSLIDSHSDDSNQLEGLRDEIQHRWQHHSSDTPALKGLQPSDLIQFSPGQQYAIVVDASQARLYVYENLGHSYVLADHYYMTIGKKGMGKSKEGDLQTPVGVYSVTNYLPGEELPPRYGPGAYLINYPNEFDRREKRTGYGIWIHGTEPDNYNRIPLASDGCVSLSNDEFLDIEKYIKIDGTTPVIISDNIDWIDKKQALSYQLEIKSFLYKWKKDWESLDIDLYLNNYSKSDFANSEHNFQSWVSHKKWANQSKKFIKIGMSNLSIFSYPGDEEMVVIDFDQEYISDNYRSVSPKKQYWKKNSEGSWKIIYEG